MGRNFEALCAGFAGHIGVDADQVVLALAEQHPVPLVSARGKLRLLGPAQPFDRVIVGPPAARALQPGWPLLGLLGKKLTLVH
jgi:hypothetical protein